jgi:hypothetical protein
MRKFITVIAAIMPLSGCAQQMVCQATTAPGYSICTAVVPYGYAVQPAYTAPRPAYSVIPDPGPGYAPAYPSYSTHDGHTWVTDEPHWTPGDR